MSARQRTALAALAWLALGCGSEFSVVDPDAGHDGGTTDPLLDGLVAYWKLDGSPDDSTGGGTVLSACPPGNSPQHAQGKIGQGLTPGIAKTYECLDCTALESPSNPALEVGDGDFTLSIWAKRQASPAADGTWWNYALLDNGQVTLSASGAGAAPTPAYPTLRLSNGSVEIALAQDTTFDFRGPEGTGTWVHLVAYRDGGTLGLVINGTHETTATVAGSVGSAGTFYLAAMAAGYPWQGTIDEVGKWSRALEKDEIAALYNGGAGKTLP